MCVCLIKAQKLTTKGNKMKKISLIALFGVMASFSGFAMDNNANNNMMTVVSVQEVRSMPDNSPVIVRGYLVRQNGENSYVFQDDSGVINLEIDEEDWNNQTFSPNDFVEVWGEVDKNGAAITEIDVSAIKKL